MKHLIITLPDGQELAVPVLPIATHRATHYAHEFGGDVERSLAEDTFPLFKDDEYEIIDWAANNMDWSDVSAFAIRVKPADAPDFQEAWMSAPKRVADYSPAN